MTALLPPQPPSPPPARQTSVPVWPANPPALDRTGAAHLLIGIGPDPGRVVDRWAAEATEHGLPCSVWTVEQFDELNQDHLHTVLAQRLAGLRVGARLMVCGPEAAVLAVAAGARRLGLVPDEITTFALARDRISVFCAHCETTAWSAAAPGEEITCPGCRRRLEVHEHVSGHRGSYLASAVAPPEVDR